MDALFRFFLAFSHDTIILPLLVIGYIWFDRRVFYHGMCVLLAGMLFNIVLKMSFQIPLLPSVKSTGFAFPSGHMQSSVVLYAWLFLEERLLPLKIGFLIILIGIGAGLLYFKYHTLWDVGGAVFFGLLWVCLCKWVLNRSSDKTFSVMLVCVSTLCFAYVTYISGVKEHALMAYGVLIGIIIADSYFRGVSSSSHESIIVKAMSTLLCIVIFMGVKHLAPVFKSHSLILTCCKWVLVGMVMPASLAFFRMSLSSKRRKF